MATTQALFELLRRFATTMARDFEVNDVLYELCDSAVVTLDAAGAGVSVAVGEGRLKFVTSTDHAVVAIEQVQERYQAGPCVEAFRRRDVVVVPDISQTTWPHYRVAAAESGFESVVGLPLTLDDHRVGSLNVYDRRVRDWSEVDLAAARVLADVATAYLVRAGELAEARRAAAARPRQPRRHRAGEGDAQPRSLDPGRRRVRSPPVALAAVEHAAAPGRSRGRQ
jgi:GAF domain-containing protein